MFGLNPIRKAVHADTLWVQEVFPTIQGEGPFTGEPAIFVRLAGCNLKCHFCDTDFESSTWHPTLEQLLDKITIEALGGNYKLVVLTGGEPMRQNIGPLVSRLHALSFRIQIETAGTLWPEGLEPLQVHLVCSPKTPRIHPRVHKHCRDYKYIVSAADKLDPVDGLPLSSTQVLGLEARLFRPDREKYLGTRIWLQPREEYRMIVVSGEVPSPDKRRTDHNVQIAAKLCMQHGYRLSLQVHKIVGLP